MRCGFFGSTLAALASVSILSVAASASAETRTHDGFMLQLELGPGYLSVPGNWDIMGQSMDVTISGAGMIGGLLIGGTPTDGLVVGGASLSHVVTSPKIKANGKEADQDDSLHFDILGPFVQFYPDPNAGLNFRLVLGYVLAVFPNSTDDGGKDLATGFGLSASVGHDWWVGEEWSLGVAGRFTYANANVKNVKWDNDVGIEKTYKAYVPGVVFTATYH